MVNNLKKLRLRQNKKDGLYIEGAKEVFVKNYDETKDLYYQGLTNNLGYQTSMGYSSLKS